MPIGLDPNQTAPFWLWSDADKPEDTRPTFMFRFLTSKQVRQVREIYDRASKLTKNDEDSEKLVDEGILIGLAGWSNLPVPFAPDKLGDVLTMTEKWEMLRRYPTVVTEEEGNRIKKAFASPSASATDNSAKAASEPAVA